MKILVISNMYPSINKPYSGTFVKACVEGYHREGIYADISRISTSDLRGYLAFYMATFWKLLTGDFNVAHVHYVTHSVPPVLLARLFRKFKIILNFHGSDAFPEKHENKSRRKIKKIISDLAIRYSDLVVVPSEYFMRKMMDSYSLRSIFVSPSGGVDPDLFNFRSGGGRNVLFAGRMLKEKGPVIAARAVRENYSMIDHVVFIGDGPEKDNVETELKDLDVSYMGLVSHDELAKQMAEHDIFLFPSTREGESLGLVVIEAVFSGMIPVVIDNGAVREIIDPRYHALLISDDDSCYTSVLARVLTISDTGLEEVKKNLYSYAKDKYAADNVSRNLISALYCRLG